MRPAWFLLLLASCAPAVCPQPAPPVAAELQVCPDGVTPPPPPPAPRTIEQVGFWAVRVRQTWAATEYARRECARRLDRLNAWIDRSER